MVVLLAAAALTLVIADYADAAVILLVVLVNTVLSVRQEVGADRALAALESLAAPTCVVVRDGHHQERPVAHLVPGDLVVLAEGALVPADGQVVDAVALRVDESTLTGESVPVEKSSEPSSEDSRRLLAGTAVLHGRGLMVVEATGSASAVGRIAALIGVRTTRTPLQRRMAHLSQQLAVVAVALSAVVLVLGWSQGQELELMLVTAASLVVAAVPESLPAVVAVSLALGARRMAQHGAVVRQLAAVETLGSVTLLATDKTGTLTEASMTVTDWWVPAGREPAALRRAVRLCNDARVDPATGREAGYDPTEVALLQATPEYAEQAAALVRVAEVPFDSARKRMTTVHALQDGDLLVVSKGAPEAVLDTRLLKETPDLLADARRRADELSAAGLRVLAVATRRVAGPPADAPDQWEQGLHLLGLVALQDPARTSAAATLRECRAAGIRLALVTGDHAATAQHIAEQVGLSPSPLRVLDLAAEPQHRLVAGAAADVDVIARATPADKLQAVSDWQRAGHVVAMTGDGVNDAPALHRADIGVAMGRRGTEVARQSADLVLEDDDLATLVSAVEEGRRVYANIRRFLLYGMSGGAAELVVMLVGPLTGTPLPLLPSQILWVNLLTHSIVGTAMGSEPVEAAAMRRPPRDPAEGVLGGGLWWRVLALAAVISALGGLVAVTAEPDATRSALMVGLGAPMLGVALGARARARTSRGGRSVTNPMLPASVILSALLLLAAVTIPPLQELLSTTVLGWQTLAASGAAAAVGYGATRVLRLR